VRGHLVRGTWPSDPSRYGPPQYRRAYGYDAGVLRPLSDARRNRSWEAVGLLDLLARLEADPLGA
jgi:hypothetical protein